MTAPFQYFLITVNVIALEEVSFSDTQNPKVNTLTVNDKHYLLNQGYLTQPIQMQFSEKQKTFSDSFFAVLKPILNFKDFPKKDDPRS